MKQFARTTSPAAGRPAVLGSWARPAWRKSGRSTRIHVLSRAANICWVLRVADSFVVPAAEPSDITMKNS